jgi:hypothetical protein
MKAYLKLTSTLSQSDLGKLITRIFFALLRVAATLLTLFILWKAGGEYYNFAWGTGNTLGQFSPKLAIGFVGMLGVWALIFFLVAADIWWRDKVYPLDRFLAQLRNRVGWLRWILAAAVLGLSYWFLHFTYWGGVFTGAYLRFMLMAGAGLAAGALVSRKQEILIRVPDVAAGLLLVASAFYLGQALEWVTSYPFNLSWSEGNRFWDYSVLFGHRLYNFPADQKIFAYIDWGRQSLWGLPFLFAKPTILEIRLWNGLLFSVPYAIFGWVVFKKTRENTGVWLLSGLWTFVFLSQGPIYTPLVLSAILVALAWRRPLWIGLPLIFIAAYYAQITRSTWMFAPALWAGMLFFASGKTDLAGWHNWKWGPAFAGILTGVLGGYVWPREQKILAAAQALFTHQAVASGLAPSTSPDIISVEGFTEVINRQPLLWERLLPNMTYQPGILIGLLTVITPVVIFLIFLVWTRRWKIDKLQGLVILAVLTAFLAVGLVVSVKIGGGSNLHNLDMFLIALVFTAAIAWQAGGDRLLANLNAEPAWLQWLLVVAIAYLAFQPVLGTAPLVLPPEETIQKALNTIRQEVDDAQDDGEILFMDQRQLLTFGYVQSIPLVPDYEKKYMMDNALSSDADYFEGFYKDLANARFSLIISEPLRVKYWGSEHQFGDENDAWVKWISEPVLCYYKPIKKFQEVKVQLLVPRPNTQECKEKYGY